MSKWTATRLAQSSVVVASVSVASWYSYNWTCTPTPKPQAASLAATGALFSNDAIVGAFTDPETLADVNTLLLEAFKKDIAKEALKDFFKDLFTNDEVTTKALNTFLVDKVLADPWVQKRLIDLALEIGQGIQNDKLIWAGDGCETLAFLGDASLEALKTEEFRRDAEKAVKASVYKAIPGF